MSQPAPSLNSARDGAPAPRRVTVGPAELEVFEEGKGQPLLILHGFLEQPRWNPYLALLARKHRVIAPSLPGFGGSARPAAVDSIEDLAYLFLEFIRTLDVPKVGLLGHSLGGWIAAEMAVRDCSGMSQLILADAVGLRTLPTPVGPVGGSIADWLVLEAPALRQRALYDPARTIPAMPLPEDPGLGLEELEAVYRAREAATQYGWSPFFFNPRLGRWLGRIRVPALILWGERDGVVPLAVGEAYAAGIAGARLETVPQSAHLPHLENPEGFATAVERFLAAAN